MISRSLVQPIGQKRLTNIAVVRLKKHGNRFEIACFKNKVLSWRSGVEKDLDEVLQSRTVYSNVSKGVLAKSKELLQAFGTTDENKICLEILEKGELQVAGKEREAQLSSQFRDIATLVMEKTVNPETERPYTISMIERLMHEVHFAVDPHRNSKQQALELIKELEKHFPIARARMRLRLVMPDVQKDKIIDQLKLWKAQIESEECTNGTFSLVCQVDPGHFRECDAFTRSINGRLEVLSMGVQKEGEESVYEIDLNDHVASRSSGIAKDPSLDVPRLADRMEQASVSNATVSSIRDGRKHQKCLTCNAEIDAGEFREHYKGDWHRHNLKRKLKLLPPLSAEECLVDTELVDERSDLNDYCR